MKIQQRRHCLKYEVYEKQQKPSVPNTPSPVGNRPGRAAGQPDRTSYIVISDALICGKKRSLICRLIGK